MSSPPRNPNGASTSRSAPQDAAPQNSSAPADSNGATPGTIPPEVIELASMLFEGARRGNVALFEQVLGHNSSVKNLRNEKGDTLIMLAAYHGHLPLVHLLLSHHADPNILNDRQQSPLAGAIFKGEKEVVEALSDAGADWDVGEPSAREAVRLFRQEDVWRHRLGAAEGGGGTSGGEREGRL